MNATLKRIGGSLALIIPKSMSEGLVAGQQVELVEHPEGILVSRPRTRVRRVMDNLIKQVDPKIYARHAKSVFCDPPVGKEVW